MVRFSFAGIEKEFRLKLSAKDLYGPEAKLSTFTPRFFSKFPKKKLSTAGSRTMNSPEGAEYFLCIKESKYKDLMSPLAANPAVSIPFDFIFSI